MDVIRFDCMLAYRNNAVFHVTMNGNVSLYDEFG